MTVLEVVLYTVIHRSHHTFQQKISPIWKILRNSSSSLMQHRDVQNLVGNIRFAIRHHVNDLQTIPAFY